MSQDHASLPDSEIAIENREWIESLDYVYANQGPERVLELLRLLQVRAQENGVEAHFSANTPYINTIPVSRQPVFPGSREIERRIKSIIRWNAMAMVVRANREERRYRRPYFHLCLQRHPVRGRLQPLFSRKRRTTPAMHLFPGACRTRHLRPGLFGGAAG
jgi:hypothetical protein